MRLKGEYFERFILRERQIFYDKHISSVGRESSPRMILWTRRNGNVGNWRATVVCFIISNDELSVYPSLDMGANNETINEWKFAFFRAI